MQIYPWEQNMHVLACDLLSLATFYGWLAARFLAGLQHLTHDGIAAGGLSPWRNLHCTRDWTSTFLSMTKLLRYKLYRTMLKSVGSFSRPGGRRKEEGDRSEQDGVKSEENIGEWWAGSNTFATLILQLVSINFGRYTALAIFGFKLGHLGTTGVSNLDEFSEKLQTMSRFFRLFWEVLKYATTFF